LYLFSRVFDCDLLYLFGPAVLDFDVAVGEGLAYDDVKRYAD
jgi:hypothetical protein